MTDQQFQDAKERVQAIASINALTSQLSWEEAPITWGLAELIMFSQSAHTQSPAWFDSRISAVVNSETQDLYTNTMDGLVALKSIVEGELDDAQTAGDTALAQTLAKTIGDIDTALARFVYEDVPNTWSLGEQITTFRMLYDQSPKWQDARIINSITDSIGGFYTALRTALIALGATILAEFNTTVPFALATATPSTLPAANDDTTIYIASEPGTYTHFPDEADAPIVLDDSEVAHIYKADGFYVKVLLPLSLTNYVDKSSLNNALALLPVLYNPSVVPEDRSAVTFSTTNMSITGLYYEATKVATDELLESVSFKMVIASPVVHIVFLKVVGSIATVLYAIDKPGVLGLNTIAAADLSIPQSVLDQEYYIAIGPSELGSMKYNDSASGTLTVVANTGGTITATTKKGPFWISKSKNANTILSKYPGTKKQVDDSIALAPTYYDAKVPFDKALYTYGANCSVNANYGASDTYFYKGFLKKIYLNSSVSNNVVFGFYYKDANGAFQLVHSYSYNSTGAGIQVIDVATLNLPSTVPAGEKIFVFARNTQTLTTNVARYSSNNPVTREWYIIDAAGTLFTYSTKDHFNFWLENSVTDNKITQRVLQLDDRLQTANRKIPATSSYSYDHTENAPILPGQIFLLDEVGTPIYRKSLFQKFKDHSIPEVLLVSNRKIQNIAEPTYIKASDVGTTGRFIINKNSSVDKLLYKDVQIIKSTLASKVGQTVKVMCLGDSLTEGNIGFAGSPLSFLNQALTAMGITVQGIGTLQRAGASPTLRHEGRGAWRYRTFVGLESKFSSLDVVIPDPNKSYWEENVDGPENTIKANNVFLYPASTQDKIDYPQWCFHFVSGATVNNVSYAENAGLSDYLIFDPARYFSERGITIPDVLTIALGTNEWYLGGFSGFNLPLISSCVDWMITRFRQAMPTTKIVVVPCNNMPLTREAEWQTQASVLASEVMRICETKRAAGDNNLFTLSIFAHGSRVLAYGAKSGDANISSNNTTKIATIDTNVHMLDVDDDSRADYKDALATCVAVVM